MKHFFPNAPQQGVLSAEEADYVRSLKRIMVDEPAVIAALVREVSTGYHPMTAPQGAPVSPPPIRFTCYGGDERLAVFTALGNIVVTGGGCWLKYDNYLKSTRFVPLQIRPLVLRGRCAQNLSRIGIVVRGGFAGEPEKGPSSCANWCDALLYRDNARNASTSIRRLLSFHSEIEGKCHYAMNIGWEANSPSDMVLLFEAEAGWNQCGGPELFAFNHHEPKGGLVLLNDGTVKFIRTEEELRQLRWK